MKNYTIEEATVVEQELFKAPVPLKTDSYSPVSHANIITAVQEEADKRGLEIRNKHYWSNREGQQVTGKFNIIVPGDEEMGMMAAFRNSYDKSMSLGFAAGGNVWICTNGMVSGDITIVKRHVGSIVQEVSEKIILSMDQLEDQFETLVKQKNRMKEIEVSKSAMAKLAGQMYIEEEVISLTQINQLKKEISGSENFQDENLWCFYNHITESLKHSTAVTYLDNHIQAHSYIEEKFELV